MGTYFLEKLPGEGEYTKMVQTRIHCPCGKPATHLYRYFRDDVQADVYTCDECHACPVPDFSQIGYERKDPIRICTANAHHFLEWTYQSVQEVPPPESRDKRQKLVGEWAERCFGKVEAISLPQRGLRLAEEAIETAQAAGTDRELIHKLVDYVYDRPVGDLKQEIGGVHVTLLALCQAAGMSADIAERDEVNRILSKPAKHFAERNQLKKDAGFITEGA